MQALAGYPFGNPLDIEIIEMTITTGRHARLYRIADNLIDGDAVPADAAASRNTGGRQP
jgi:hypothetical protein